MTRAHTENPDGSAAWLVAIPLAGISMDRAWARAGSAAAVRRAWDADAAPDPQTDPWTSTKKEAKTEFAVFHHLGDRLGPPTRLVRSVAQQTIDTRATASLLMLQDGPRRAALQTARAKAHYAVATWALLAPPDRGQLSPGVAVRAPQPDHLHEPPYKLYEENEWLTQGHRHDGELARQAAYPLPGDAVLAAPFEAFARLERRPAQALLSSAAALYSARPGTDAPLAERILSAERALRCLCQPADGGDATPRWERLAKRSGTWARMGERLGYTDELVRGMERRMRDLGVAAQAGGAALIDLGPEAGERIAAVLDPTLTALGETLRSAWVEMRSADFDDGAFEELFRPGRR